MADFTIKTNLYELTLDYSPQDASAFINQVRDEFAKGRGLFFEAPDENGASATYFLSAHESLVLSYEGHRAVQ